jgi:hypothetical protein
VGVTQADSCVPFAWPLFESGRNPVCKTLSGTILGFANFVFLVSAGPVRDCRFRAQAAVAVFALLLAKPFFSVHHHHCAHDRLPVVHQLRVLLWWQPVVVLFCHRHGVPRRPLLSDAF